MLCGGTSSGDARARVPEAVGVAGEKAAPGPRTRRAAVAILVVASLLVAFNPGVAQSSTETSLPAAIVIETQLHPGESDPNRCIAVAFLQFSDIAGVKTYRGTYFDDLYSADVDRFGPPFHDDDYTYGQFNSTVAAGTHRWELSTFSTGAGCIAANDALKDRFTNPRVSATYRTCFGRDVTIAAQVGVTTYGTSGPDVILGTNSADDIRSGGGKDRVCSLGGNDIVRGGSGSAEINLGSGDDKAWVCLHPH